MHQQSMYNVHTLYTPTGGHGKWPVPAALCIFCIFYVLRQMALSNGLKLALDWHGLALDLLGLAQIGQLTNFPFFVKN